MRGGYISACPPGVDMKPKLNWPAGMATKPPTKDLEYESPMTRAHWIEDKMLFINAYEILKY